MGNFFLYIPVWSVHSIKETHIYTNIFPSKNIVKSKKIPFLHNFSTGQWGSIFEVMIKSITLAYRLTDALLVPIISSNEFLKHLKYLKIISLKHWSIFQVLDKLCLTSFFWKSLFNNLDANPKYWYIQSQIINWAININCYNMTEYLQSGI